MEQKKNAKFCYYEIPAGEEVLALLGAEYIRDYGYEKRGEYSAEKHFHNLMEIAICRGGHGEVHLDSRTYNYGPGCVAVIPKNIPHTIISMGPEKSFWEYLYLNPAGVIENCGSIEKRERKQYLDLVLQQPFFQNREGTMMLASEINLLMDQMRIKGFGYRHCVRGLAQALVVEIARINYGREKHLIPASAPDEDKTQKIAKALDYIDEHYAQKVKVTDIAGAAYISSTYLRRLFLEYCGMTPMQYLNYVRIQAACKLMRKTDYNINEIAQKVGYENLATFINNFKVYAGETPKRWKEKQ